MRWILLAGLLVACGGSPAPAPSPPPSPPAAAPAAPPPTAPGSDVGAMLAKLDEFSDRICACRDKACVDAVTAEMARWGEDIAKLDTSGPEFTAPAAQQHAEATSQRMSDCMVKILAPGAGAKPR